MSVVWLTKRRCDQPRYATIGRKSRARAVPRRGHATWGREVRLDPVRQSDLSTLEVAVPEVRAHYSHFITLLKKTSLIKVFAWEDLKIFKVIVTNNNNDLQ